jgi:hypothetical protein
MPVFSIHFLSVRVTMVKAYIKKAHFCILLIIKIKRAHLHKNVQCQSFRYILSARVLLRRKRKLKKHISDDFIIIINYHNQKNKAGNKKPNIGRSIDF